MEDGASGRRSQNIGGVRLPHYMLFLRVILFPTNEPTWKSALRAGGAPGSKPARRGAPQGQRKNRTKLREVRTELCRRTTRMEEGGRNQPPEKIFSAVRRDIFVVTRAAKTSSSDRSEICRPVAAYGLLKPGRSRDVSMKNRNVQKSRKCVFNRHESIPGK